MPMLTQRIIAIWDISPMAIRRIFVLTSYPFELTTVTFVRVISAVVLAVTPDAVHDTLPIPTFTHIKWTGFTFKN